MYSAMIVLTSDQITSQYSSFHSKDMNCQSLQTECVWKIRETPYFANLVIFVHLHGMWLVKCL